MNVQDYEKHVVGSMVLDPESIEPVRLIVSREDFADPDLAEFFELLCNLHDLGRPTNDISLLTTEVKRRNLSITAGDIGEAFTLLPHASHATYYADAVAEASRLRKLAALADDTRDRVLSAGDDSEAVVSFVESRLKSINVNKAIDLDDANMIADTYAPEERSDVMTFSGLYRIDQNFGGFGGGELICLGARLGTGKTALGWQIMLHSLKRDRPCLFVSLEMKSSQLFERHLSAETGVSSLRIRSGELLNNQRDAVEAERERFRDYPVSVFAPPRATVRQIAAAAKLKQSGSGLALLVIDYYQLIRSTVKRTERRVELEEISRELKSLAIELDVPVIALAQLNRQADNVAPRVAQIAESDSIGRDADQVWLLHRRQEDRTDIRIAKHRYVADNAAIEYRYDCGRFRDASEFVP